MWSLLYKIFWFILNNSLIQSDIVKVFGLFLHLGFVGWEMAWYFTLVQYIMKYTPGAVICATCWAVLNFQQDYYSSMLKRLFGMQVADLTQFSNGNATTFTDIWQVHTGILYWDICKSYFEISWIYTARTSFLSKYSNYLHKTHVCFIIRCCIVCAL